MDNNKYEFIRKFGNLLKLGDVNIKALSLCEDDVVEVKLSDGRHREIDVNECTPIEAIHKISERLIEIEG